MIALYPYQQKIMEALMKARQENRVVFLNWPRRWGRATLAQMFVPDFNSLLGVKITEVRPLCVVHDEVMWVARPTFGRYNRRPRALRGRRAKPRSKGG